MWKCKISNMYVKSRPNASLGICLKIDFAGFYYHFPVKSMKSAQKLPNVNKICQKLTKYGKLPNIIKSWQNMKSCQILLKVKTWSVRISVCSLCLIVPCLAGCAHSAICYSVNNAMLSWCYIMPILIFSIYWSTVCVDAKNADNEDAEHEEDHAGCTNINPGPRCTYDIFWIIEITLHEN